MELEGSKGGIVDISKSDGDDDTILKKRYSDSKEYCNICQDWTGHTNSNCPELVCKVCSKNGHVRRMCPALGQNVKNQKKKGDKHEEDMIRYVTSQDFDNDWLGNNDSQRIEDTAQDHENCQLTKIKPKVAPKKAVEKIQEVTNGAQANTEEESQCPCLDKYKGPKD